MKRQKVHTLDPGTNGQFLTITGGIAVWALAPLDSLSDVTITSPATGQVIRWSGAAWVNVALAIGDVTGLQAALDGKASSTHTHSLNALTDVDTATVAPEIGQALIWDGTQWEPGIPSPDMYVLLEAGQTAANVPAGTPVGALIVMKAAPAGTLAITLPVPNLSLTGTYI